MTRFVAIDLANLPAPTAVVPPDAATILAARKADIVAKVTAVDPALGAEIVLTLGLESEPLTKNNEAATYRELIHYQRVNEAVQAVLLPTSTGADLDNLCSRLDVYRMTLAPADPTTTPPTPALMESDVDLRYRYQLAPEAFSTAGPYGAYEFVARSAHPQVKDVGVYGPESGLVSPGQVLVVVLSRLGDGTANQDIIDAVAAALTDQDTRPLTDQVLVRSATIMPYAISYHLEIRPGANPALIVAQALAKLTAFADSAQAYAAAVAVGYTGTSVAFANLLPNAGGVLTTKVGRAISVSALDACANADVVNVIRAVKLQPDAEVNPGLDGAVYCTNVMVDYEIVDG